MIRKTLSFMLFVLLIVNSLGVISVSAVENDIATIEFSEPENLGKPIVSTTLLNSVTAVEDGVPTLYTTVSGSPAKFNVFDLVKGESVRSFDMEFGNTAWVHAVDSKGNVYVAGYTNATLYRYSPEDKSFTDLGRVAGESAVTAFAIDNNDNVFIGTYPNAKIVKYDPVSNEMTDFGNILPGESYMKTLFFYDGVLYGGGDSPSTKFMKLNLRTMEKTFIEGPKTSKPIKSYYSGRISGTKAIIYCGVQPSGAIYTVFDFEKEKFVDVEIPNAQGLYASPEHNGFAYMVADRKLYKYDLENDTYEETGISYGSGFRGGGFVEIPDDSGSTKKMYANVLYSGDVTLTDFNTGDTIRYTGTIDPVGTSLVSVKAAGDYVYVSGHMGPTASQYDPEKREIVASFPMGQSTPIKEIDGKIYFSCYPNVDLQVFDPTKPVTANENPKKLFEIDKEHGQSRPMDIVKAGDKIVVSTIADYGYLEGAIIIYDTTTGQSDVYKNIIKNQSVCGLAYKDGILYGSTTVFGGLGSTPTEQEAKIFKFNMDTKKVIREVVPKPINETTPVRMAGGLEFGPDGLLWSISDGLVFAMNPDTLEIVKEKNVKGFNWASFSSRWNPYGLEFDENGLLYCTPRNTAVVLNPETMEYKDILPGEYEGVIGELSLSDDGYIYFRHRDTLYRVHRTDEGAKILEKDTSVSLMLGSTKSIVRGQETELDVPANTVEGRTVVPVRFISEAFDADVEWDEATSKVTISKGEKVVSVVIGENILVENDVEIALDVPAFLEDGRTLLPLRAVAEALDKNVFWDERGLIVIGDTIPDKEKDIAKIEQLIEKLKK